MQVSRDIEQMKHFSSIRISQATDEGLTIYGIINTDTGFPKDSRLKRNQFLQNKVAKDAIWCKFSIGSLPRVIGHIINDNIYVVFFDIDHAFWPSK